MTIAKREGLLAVRHANLSRQEDLEAIARMEIAANSELRPKFKFDFSDDGPFKKCVELIRNLGDNTKIVLATLAEQSAGYIEYFLNERYRHIDGRMLFVYPEFRRLGVGSALINARNEDARLRGYNLIKTDANPGAHPFLVKSGFVDFKPSEYDGRMVLSVK